MATAQAVKTITESASLSATQNLLAALVSELCFVRNIFDKNGMNPLAFKVLCRCCVSSAAAAAGSRRARAGGLVREIHRILLERNRGPA